jgi:hypothetical protein
LACLRWVHTPHQQEPKKLSGGRDPIRVGFVVPTAGPSVIYWWTLHASIESERRRPTNRPSDEDQQCDRRGNVVNKDAYIYASFEVGSRAPNLSTRAAKPGTRSPLGCSLPGTAPCRHHQCVCICFLLFANILSRSIWNSALEEAGGAVWWRQMIRRAVRNKISLSPRVVYLRDQQRHTGTAM